MKKLNWEEVLSCLIDDEVPQELFDPCIELLSDILSSSGYGYDKSSNTENSGVYDVAHLNMVRYCDFLFTTDKKIFQKKVKQYISCLKYRPKSF